VHGFPENLKFKVRFIEDFFNGFEMLLRCTFYPDKQASYSPTPDTGEKRINKACYIFGFNTEFHRLSILVIISKWRRFLQIGFIAYTCLCSNAIINFH